MAEIPQRLSPKENAPSIQWIENYGVALARAQSENKKIFLFFYTTWCAYCEKMGREVFTNPQLLNLLSSKFIPLKLNRERLFECRGALVLSGKFLVYLPLFLGNMMIEMHSEKLLQNLYKLFLGRIGMFEALLAFGKHLIATYGLSGLFVLSFFTSLVIVPVPIDLFLMAGIAGGLSPLYSGLLASVGTTLGAGVDFYLGYLGSRFIFSRFHHKDFHRASEWIKKHGAIAILISSFLPIPYDIVAITAGAGRMSFSIFLLFSLLGKVIKYLAVAYAFVGGAYLLAQNPVWHTELKVAGMAVMLMVLLYYIRGNNKNTS